MSRVSLQQSFVLWNQTHSHHTFLSLTTNLVGASFVRKGHCSIYSPCQHLSISKQPTVAKPWEANWSSGRCPGMTSQCIYHMLGWLCPSLKGHAAPWSTHFHTNCTGQQLSFPYIPPAERTAAPWEAIFFPYRKRGGSKGQYIVFTVIYSFMGQIAPSMCERSINTSSVL